MQLLLDAINRENPYAIILTGDFNARSPLFWQDETLENSLGKKLSNLMLFNQMDQIINEATHFPRENIGTCIDLIYQQQGSFHYNTSRHHHEVNQCLQSLHEREWTKNHESQAGHH